MRTIAISGASGFIGTALSDFLRQNGARVRPLVRPGKQAPDGIPWDPEQGTIDAAELEGCDIVVHLAGDGIADGRWTSAKKKRIRDSRVLGTRLLARTLARLQNRPAAFVSSSAVGLYGDRGSQEVDESAPPASGFLAEVAKEWEAEAEPAAQAGIRVVHPRFGVVLDPRGGALAKMLTPFKLGVAGRLGDGKQYMSWVALEDAVRATAHLMNQDDLHGGFNVTAPVPVTNDEFTKALGTALHRPTILPAPAALLRLALGEMADAALLGGARAVPKRLLASGFAFRYAELARYFESAKLR